MANSLHQMARQIYWTRRSVWLARWQHRTSVVPWQRSEDKLTARFCRETLQLMLRCWRFSRKIFRNVTPCLVLWCPQRLIRITKPATDKVVPPVSILVYASPWNNVERRLNEPMNLLSRDLITVCTMPSAITCPKPNPIIEIGAISQTLADICWRVGYWRYPESVGLHRINNHEVTWYWIHSFV